MNKIKRYLFIFVMGMMALPSMEFFAKIARVLRRRGTGESVFFRYSENGRTATLEEGLQMTLWNAIQEVGFELEAAERKFPAFPTDPVHAAAILQKEAGELMQASLHFTYEKGSREAMRKEAVQMGAMALRFLLNLPSMVSHPSEQKERKPGIKQRPIVRPLLDDGNEFIHSEYSNKMA